MMIRAIERVTVWTGEEILDDATILLCDRRIEAIRPAGTRLDVGPDVERIDGAGRLAIPGLVNAHTHLYSSLARGMSVSPFRPRSFGEILEQLWWKLDRALDQDSIRASALVGGMEAARCGVTTLIDHHASPNAIPGCLDLLREEACDRLGLRGVFCYELTDRDGSERAERGIEENLRFLAAHEGPVEGSAPLQVAGLVGLHASFTIRQATLERVAGALPDGAGVHIHVAEGPEDEEHCVREHGRRIADRLDALGLLRPTSVLAHALHVDEAEKDLFALRDAIVVHNPRSNMNNAVGRFDLGGFLRRGVLTGLGTDGLGANLFGELFAAGLLQKHGRRDPLAAPFDELHALLFRNNATIAARLLGGGIGRIAEGGPADLALLEYVPPTPFGSGNALGHLLFGVAVHGLRVSDLFVDGRRILEDGRFAEIDERAAYAAAREQARRLWARLG